MTHPLELYAMVFGGTFLATALLVPVFRAIARRLDIVDRPAEARKVHGRVVPYLGGVPFYLCFLGAGLFIEIF